MPVILVTSEREVVDYSGLCTEILYQKAKQTNPTSPATQTQVSDSLKKRNNSSSTKMNTHTERARARARV